MRLKCTVSLLWWTSVSQYVNALFDLISADERDIDLRSDGMVGVTRADTT